jgi:hypothetical protein
MKWNNAYGEMMEKFVAVHQVDEFFGRAYLRTATADSAFVGIKKRVLPS